MRKVLVTGGTGFVGSVLLKALIKSKKYEVHATRRVDSDMSLVGDIKHSIMWHEADITDYDSLYDALYGIEKIIHAAAYIGSNKDKLERINITGTKHMVNCALARGVKRFIYVGSVTALGGLRDMSLNEKHYWPEAPLDLDYGYSKYLAEQEVWRASAEGLEVATILPSYVIGPNVWLGDSDIFSEVYNRAKYYPAGSMGIVDVSDVVRMLLLLLDGSLPDFPRYICSGENLTYERIMNMIGSAMDKKTQRSVLSLPSWKSYLIKILSAVHALPSIDVQFLRLAQLSLTYDNAKSRDELNFVYTSVSTTIKRTSAAFLERKNKGK